MEGLNSRLSSLKKAIQRQQNDDIEFRKCVEDALVFVFGHTKHVKEVTRNKKNIILTAVNKIAAQEIFLHREEVLKKIQNIYKEYKLIIK